LRRQHYQHWLLLLVPGAGTPPSTGIDLYQWIFLLAPVKTPKRWFRAECRRRKSSRCARRQGKAHRDRFEAAPGTAQQLERMIREALERWGKRIPEPNIKPE
jgi:hypothetical protein